MQKEKPLSRRGYYHALITALLFDQIFALFFIPIIIIILLVINYIKGKEEINVFNKKISSNAINRAIVVISISIFIIIITK